MDYKDANGEWIGFDADLGRIVAEKLGVDIEFREIETTVIFNSFSSAISLPAEPFSTANDKALSDSTVV